MNFINEYLNKIKIKKEEKEKRKKDILTEFELFLNESKPVAPRAKKIKKQLFIGIYGKELMY